MSTAQKYARLSFERNVLNRISEIISDRSWWQDVYCVYTRVTGADAFGEWV